MARRVSNNHYIATHGLVGGDDDPTNYNTNSHPRNGHIGSHVVGNGNTNRAYSTDGEESHRAASERTLSEYTAMGNDRTTSPIPVAPSRKTRSSHHHHHQNGSQHGGSHTMLVPPGGPPARPPPRAPSQLSYGENGSDIYVTSAAYKAPSEISRGSRYSQPARSLYSYRSGAAPSVMSGRTNKSRRSRTGGATVEAMAAPNPFCPNIRGVCCLLLLLNLGLILVTLGFVIVIQFFEPLFVWILGIVFLIFGFLTLIGSMIYCVLVCRDARSPRDVNPEQLYWTHHWQKSIGHTPGAQGYSKERFEDRDGYSDHYSVSKLSGKYSDRESNRY